MMVMPVTTVRHAIIMSGVYAEGRGTEKTDTRRRKVMKTASVLSVAIILLLVGYAYAGNFSDNGDGTVTDNDTGLMWQQEDDDTLRIWQQALDYCNGLLYAGYADWRLPDVKELESLTDDTIYNPAINTTVFPNTTSKYWSSTTSTNDTFRAWSVGFSIGSVYNDDKTYGNYVKCVR